jgi:hypothetical protein
LEDPKISPSVRGVGGVVGGADTLPLLRRLKSFPLLLSFELEPLRGGLSALILALKQQPMKTELTEELREQEEGTEQVEVAKKVKSLMK